ncbi:Transcription repressor OFP7 [Raphanus sativus]|uniref:Transcription repressor n=1 Tax=Raphanus sativus TaxID=3726 RepID=A0A6J0JQJ0_RAPSA|nr:transcription repressor OFP7-like [Raphanus sativus]KAJ4889015.1 Transcription repressor OFP7 [Raphanus sativus]
MAKRFKIKISRILSFKSCRSKDPSDLPFNPVRSFPRPPPPPANPTTTVPPRRRSSFRQHVFTTFGCGSTRRRSSTPLDVSRRNSRSLSPPHTPTFQWESEEKWHVIAQEDGREYETPRRKIYDGDDRRRSVKKERHARRRGSISSAEEYEEETGRESLLPSSTNLSPESSSSGLPRVTRRRRRHQKRNNTSLVVEEKSDESSSPPPSPARLSSFVQRFIPCTAAAPVVMEGVAVVKRSEDPYEDFKGSMMEMIVEKNMFEVAELEQLLSCFLTLNAKRHHRMIVKAFSEVWVALFSGGNNSSRRSSVRLSDYDEC